MRGRALERAERCRAIAQCRRHARQQDRPGGHQPDRTFVGPWLRDQVRAPSPEGITPRLQRFLDSLEVSPAIIKTATWDVVAWNRAAAVVLTDYGKLAPTQRNILRLVFCNPPIRAAQEDWESTARFVVGAFRADAARAGAASEVGQLVAELCNLSPEFAALWRDNDVRVHGEGTKRLRHPTLGLVQLEYSGFAVDGRPNLGMIVYTPATDADAYRIRSLIEVTSLA